MKIFLFLFLITPLSLHGQSYDLLIVNGRIVDGTGNSWFRGDVAVKDGKIVKVGKIDAPADAVIDAKGLIVAPGFIDVHTHIETNDFNVPTADNFIYDGVTSVVTGNCGGSNIDLDKYFFQLDSVGLSINVASLIGHNSVRREVMGDAMRAPTIDEQRRMESLVAKAMNDGAVGLSTGLIYVPGTYAKTNEVIGLAKVAATHNGVYASHIRDEGDQVLEAINEAINIGKEANMAVEISHFKVTYKPNWGRSAQTILLVEKARDEGIDVTIDQYPYIASSTTLSTTVTSWVSYGGDDSLKARLDDPVTRKKIRHEMVASLKKKQMKDFSYAVVARYLPDSTFNGKSISEVNRLKGRKANATNEAETILEMIVHGRVQMVFFSMNEEDLRRILRYPFNMIASDAGIVTYGSGVPHPRAYGTNARVLGKYVREEKIIPLEEAIRKMTSLPAQKFQLHDRGLIREGMAADIVIFDESKIKDEATFSLPHAYASGFEYVIVNGEITLKNGRHTGRRDGQVLFGAGKGDEPQQD